MKRLHLCYTRLLQDFGQKKVQNEAIHGLYNVVVMQIGIEVLDRIAISIEEAYEVIVGTDRPIVRIVYEAFVRRLDVERMVDCITTTIRNIDDATICNLVDYEEKRLIQEMHRTMKGGIS